MVLLQIRILVLILYVDDGSTLTSLPQNLCANNTTTLPSGKNLQTARLPISGADLSIGASAFQDSSIQTINLKQAATVKSIGDFVFAGCTNLASTNLNKLDSLSYIGENAFGQCSNLISFDGLVSSANDTDTKLYLKSNSASGLEIADQAFIETKITNLKFGNVELYTISDLAFASCK